MLQSEFTLPSRGLCLCAARQVLSLVLVLLVWVGASAQTSTTRAAPRDPVADFERAEFDVKEPEPVVVPPETAPLETGPLELDACVAIALRRNPAVLAARATARQLYYAFKYSSSIPSTQLTLGHTHGYGSAASNSYSAGVNLPDDNYLQLNQSFWALGSFTTGKRVALHNFRSGQANVRAAEVTLVQSVKDAFFTVLDAEEKERLASSNLDFATKIYTIAQRRFTDGSGPKIDLLNAEVQLNLARQMLLQAQCAQTQARAQLNPLLGRPGHAPLELKGTLLEPSRDLVYESLMALAGQHPQIESARESLLQAQQTVKYNAQQANPTPGLWAVYDFASPSYIVGVSLSIPLSWGQIGYQTKQSEELSKVQEANVQATLQSVSANLKVSYTGYLTAAQNANLFRKDILGPQETIANITSIGYSKGAVAFNNLLLAQQNLVQLRSQYADALLAVHIAFDALEAAVGGNLDAIPPPPSLTPKEKSLP